MGGGGHTSQIQEFVKRFLNDGEIVEVDERDYIVPRRHGEFVLKTIIYSLVSFIVALVDLYIKKADILVSAGPGIGAVYSYAAKVLGKKVIFIESWSRVYKKSTTGKLVYPIADVFYVQWDEMLELYPSAIVIHELKDRWK